MAFNKKKKAEKGKPQSNDLFVDIQNNFTKGNAVTTDSPSGISFIMARFLSMYPYSFNAAAFYNDVSKGIPSWASRPVLFHCTPKLNRAPYIKYIGKGKAKLDEKFEQIIDKIQNHFKCKRHHAIEIYGILTSIGKNPKVIFGVE